MIAIFVCSHLQPLTYFLFGRHISLFLFMPISFEIICTCLFIHNNNVHEMLSDIPDIFIWQPGFFFHICDHLCIPCLTDKFPGIIFCLYICKYACQCSCMHIYICMYVYMCPCMHICIFDGRHVRQCAYVYMNVCTLNSAYNEVTFNEKLASANAPNISH